jgi:hypothetical protein
MDTLITFFTSTGSVVVFILMVLGIIVTFSPPQTKKAKLYYLVAFVLAGISGIGIVVGGSINANSKQYEVIQSQLRLEGELRTARIELQEAIDQLNFLNSQKVDYKDTRKFRCPNTM